MADPALQTAISRAEEQLSGRGRVLVRPSGTEPLIRVMVEAPDAAETDRLCGELSAAVEAALGG
jgi:phosphoglucosamine mutase